MAIITEKVIDTLNKIKRELNYSLKIDKPEAITIYTEISGFDGGVQTWKYQEFLNINEKQKPMINSISQHFEKKVSQYLTMHHQNTANCKNTQ